MHVHCIVTCVHVYCNHVYNYVSVCVPHGWNNNAINSS